MFFAITFTKRWKRLIYHFTGIFYKTKYVNRFKAKGFGEWSADLLCYLADVVGIPEIYETLFDLIKWNIRPLNNKEIALAKTIFGDTIRYELVRVDDNARLGLKKLAIAYVSFNTINYKKKIKSRIFIHELVHVWQYQHFGSVYISKAIKAQKSDMVYDYGGVEELYRRMFLKSKLTDFNFEQQAEIIEDYYQISRYQFNSPSIHLNVYQYYVRQLFDV
ncbi:MAG: hypothetical protein IPM42_12580 [Saprospiraceae bacterium]|nr:hypothetical protein [Saprospiraceae bacterium]